MVDWPGTRNSWYQLPKADEEELLDSLKSAVEDMLELNRKVAIRRADGEYQTVSISV